MAGSEPDDALLRALRPRSIDSFIGQEAVRQRLYVFLWAAKQRNEALDHVLLAGPPGFGKTSLAGIIANELDVGFHAAGGPAIERKGDLGAILTALEPRDVLLIDEIDRVGGGAESVLRQAMEDFQVDLIIGQGATARTLRLDVPPFTLVGATTSPGLLSAQLRDRFGVVERLDRYTDAELARIVRRAAALLDLEIDDAGALAIASRSQGSPRIAIRLLDRVREFAHATGVKTIDEARTVQGLEQRIQMPPGGTPSLPPPQSEVSSPMTGPSGSVAPGGLPRERPLGPDVTLMTEADQPNDGNGFLARRRARQEAKRRSEKARARAEKYAVDMANWQALRDGCAENLNLARNFKGLPRKDGLVLKTGEAVFATVTRVDLVEDRRGPGRWAGRSQGVSVPVRVGGRSVRYRVGASRGQYQQGTPAPTSIDVGTLHITNQRVIFQGAKQTRECLFAKMIGYEHTPSGTMTIWISNRQKATTVDYGAPLSGWVEIRFDLALASSNGQLRSLVKELEDDLAAVEAARPIPPSEDAPLALSE